MKRMHFVLLLILLSVVVLSACQTGSVSSGSCTKGEIKADISWNGGIVLTLNHCEVRDLLAGSSAMAAASSYIASDCPNLACKLAAAGLAAFLVSQTVVLKDTDDQCGNQGAIIEVGSFKDKTLWAIKPICGTTPGHLSMANSDRDRENKLQCNAVFLSFVLQNTGQQVVKWHLAISYGNTSLQPSGLRAFIQENGRQVRTGIKPGKYDEEGLISNQKATIVVTGSIDPEKMKQYKQVTLKYIAIGGDQYNPPPVTIKCS